MINGIRFNIPHRLASVLQLKKLNGQNRLLSGDELSYKEHGDRMKVRNNRRPWGTWCAVATILRSDGRICSKTPWWLNRPISNNQVNQLNRRASNLVSWMNVW